MDVVEEVIVIDPADLDSVEEVILMDTKETAAMLVVSPDTLEKARSTGLGDYPPYIRVGRQIRYVKSEVLKWIAKRRRYRCTVEYSGVLGNAA